MLNNKKGITLVSLVITIIVLLILATVAITLAINANGILPRAGLAANSWNNAVKEEGKVNDVVNQLINQVPTLPEGYAD